MMMMMKILSPGGRKKINCLCSDVQAVLRAWRGPEAVCARPRWRDCTRGAFWGSSSDMSNDILKDHPVGRAELTMGDGDPLQMEGNALLKAVSQGKLRLSRLLLEGGAYVNEGNELGQTPVSAACLADYEDPRTRLRMVRYLLEKGADPNIPDKSGRTALMHACAKRAGKEAVSLLLENGADPSLKDYSGCSALMHALNKGDRDTLQVLLDACRAKGKEVIIITTDTSPSGTKKTKQYLNSPPSPGVVDKVSPESTPAACMSPSDVEIVTSSPVERERDKEDGIFSFPLARAPPPPNGRPVGEKRMGTAAAPPRKLLKRLNSEPWGLVAPLASAAASQESVRGRLEEAEGICRLSQRINGLCLSQPARALLSRRHSIETHEPSSPTVTDRSCSEDRVLLSPSSWADNVQQHQILYCRNPESKENTNLQIATHPKLTRSDHCEADSHAGQESIPGSPDSGPVSLERRKYNASPHSLVNSSSRESLENIPNSVSPAAARRRSPGLLERRGSGTFLLDRISHTRPGFLPPLNINPQRPIPDIRSNSKPPSPVHGTHKILVPVAPASPKRGPDFKMKKKLMRRHSMQTEQMKQLSTFQQILAEKVIESNGD
ncbi:ankyrin repeat domain-containing protein 34A isoform X1 [Hippocampus zosterae]|uniref:ankyrin repeat domain-containing protein 34A isoform X1 n=2 Tax=Hippocampus zosterae TaxID=109293 RepID=UPI00223D2853|nr:ankyrin repeat domain-containing protein 34A isoform X1 [Hippocampus zosterae]